MKNTVHLCLILQLIAIHLLNRILSPGIHLYQMSDFFHILPRLSCKNFIHIRQKRKSLNLISLFLLVKKRDTFNTHIILKIHLKIYFK